MRVALGHDDRVVAENRRQLLDRVAGRATNSTTVRIGRMKPNRAPTARWCAGTLSSWPRSVSGDENLDSGGPASTGPESVPLRRAPTTAGIMPVFGSDNEVKAANPCSLLASE
jgi:hypothetical protein